MWKTMVRQQMPLIVLLVLVGLVGSGLVLLLNRGYAGMLNAALTGQAAGIASAALLLGLAALGNGAANGVTTALGSWIAEGIGHRLRTDVAAHLLRAEGGALQHRHSGDALSRVNLELRQITDWIQREGCPLLLEGLSLCIVLAALLALNAPLTLAAFAVVPFIGLYAARASRPIGQAATERQAALAQSNALVKSVLDAFPIVKVFDLPTALGRSYGASVDRAVALSIRANSVERSLMTINGLTTLLPLAVLLGMGGAQVLGGTLTAGALLAYVNLSSYVTGPLMNLPRRISSVRTFAADVKRVEDLRSDPLESSHPGSDATQPEQTELAIALKGVTFAYDGNAPALRSLSLAVPRGSHVALVGPSGCGKSTVIRLIAALLTPQEGEVQVLGQDTRAWNLAALRGNLAVVLQEPFLFPGTMRENVTCGRDMPEEQIMAACRTAGLDELLATLPQGLDTDIGERGAKLSGGQRQRVAIARAIAKDAPILLLDEATAALDARAERDIQNALATLMQGRTVVTITHRLTSAHNADRIFCLEEGNLAEEGTYDELMARNGLFASLVRLQSGPAAAPGESRNNEGTVGPTASVVPSARFTGCPARCAGCVGRVCHGVPEPRDGKGAASDLRRGDGGNPANAAGGGGGFCAVAVRLFPLQCPAVGVVRRVHHPANWGHPPEPLCAPVHPTGPRGGEGTRRGSADALQRRRGDGRKRLQLSLAVYSRGGAVRTGGYGVAAGQKPAAGRYHPGHRAGAAGLQPLGGAAPAGPEQAHCPAD